jgi:hypothetical protein
MSALFSRLRTTVFLESLRVALCGKQGERVRGLHTHNCCDLLLEQLFYGADTNQQQDTGDPLDIDCSGVSAPTPASSSFVLTPAASSSAAVRPFTSHRHHISRQHRTISLPLPLPLSHSGTLTNDAHTCPRPYCRAARLFDTISTVTSSIRTSISSRCTVKWRYRRCVVVRGCCVL